VAKVVAALLLLALSVRAGDPEVAKFLFAKGQKEVRAKRYDAAEKLFARAIAEYSPYPEALFARGQVLERLDRPHDAATAYQACMDAVNGAEKPPSKWKSASSRAGRALTKLRRKFAALDSINRGYLKKFVAFGKKHYKSNPKWSRRAFEVVLAIDPTNASAKAYLAKLPADGDAAPTGKNGSGKGKGKRWGKALIEPGSLENWDPGATDTWSIRDDVITGDGVTRDGHINWLESVSLPGKFSLQVKIRIVRDGADRRTVGLFFGDGKDAWWALMIEHDDYMSLIRHERGTNTAVSSRELPKIKWSSWHTLRIEVDKENAEFFFDDKRIIEIEVPRRQRFGGMFGFFVQRVKAQFKELELRK